ncbi:MAG: 23S rRNA (adenine(2503)-C(2))-methyltransferase RlmN [Pseudomonadota bacterium]
MSAPLNLLDLDRAAAEALMAQWGARPFHGRNLIKWIHKLGVLDVAQMTDLPQALRTALQQQARVHLPEVVFEQPALDGTTKWLLQLPDGQRIEMVHIPETKRGTLCVSSQVGCALDCSFCSTAQQGFNRNLSTGELIAQVWLARHRLGKKVTNVVLMGMGEPLANFAAVVSAIHLMTDDLAYMLGQTRVTLSTSGIVPALYRLREAVDVSLAVSLHAPDNVLRDQLVPINRKYPLEQLIPACRAFVAQDKRRKVTWEYVMLDQVNDAPAQAQQLVRLLSQVPSKINLIPFNPFPGTAYRTSSLERILTFQRRLQQAGFVTTIRKTRGDDVAAACGQLVGKVQDRSRRQLRRVQAAT